MRWDDIELLRSIDELEEESQSFGNGMNLLQQLNQRRGVQQQEGYENFAVELALAFDAGYLTAIDRSERTVGTYGPSNDPYQWLQTFDNVRLTLAGRDRARGRLIQVGFPDPNDDDGRIITGLTLTEIARNIGDTYTPTQLPGYLRDSGLSPEVVPPAVEGDKWEYVFNILSRLHDGGAAARRFLREFIGSWLDGQHHAPPPVEVRRRIVALLAQQGWHVTDGRLVVGERVNAEPGSVTPLGRDARFAALHPTIQEVTAKYVEDHLEVAIFEAFKAVNNRVKEMSGLDLDGSALIDETMGSARTQIWFADSTKKTGKDVQQGYYFTFKGATLGIRNPDAHEQFRPLDEEEGFEKLTFASMLMRRLDTASLGLRADGAI